MEKVPSLPLGRSAVTQWTVRSKDTAHRQGYEGVAVLSTPSLFLWMELACAKVVEGLLPEGLRHVGTRMDARHLAATPVGFPVTVDAELVDVKKRLLVFRCRARDPAELVGEGIHERLIVDWERFCRDLDEKKRTWNAKKTRLAAP